MKQKRMNNTRKEPGEEVLDIHCTSKLIAG